MTEVWRSVKGYEGLYEVSNLGQVRSLDRRTLSRYGATKLQRGRVLKPQRTYTRYLTVCLSGHKRTRNFYIHRLVLIAFTPNPDNKPYCNHKDADPRNNIVTNLEWVTPAENMAHAQARGVLGVKKRTHCIRGHLRTPETLSGSACLVCRKIWGKKRNERLREEYRKESEALANG